MTRLRGRGGSAGMGFGISRDVGVCGEPDAFVAADISDELLQDPYPRAVADDARVHGELEQAALAVRGGELAPEDLVHVGGRRAGPERAEAVHLSGTRIVADP